MLTFGKTNWLFFILLIVLIGIDFLARAPWWFYFILIFLYSVIVFYGCAFIQSNFFHPVICKAKTSEKKIALSFDDGPAGDYTPLILDILSEHQVKAAFFCIGRKIGENYALLEKTIADGHIVGNHSYSHDLLFDLFSAKKMIADLAATDKEIMQRIGVMPRLFRPPYGVMNPNLKKAIVKGNYQPVGWSVRSFDTVIKDEKKLLNKLKRSLRPGAVFLFHDTSEVTKKTLPAFIRYVKESGYHIERLDKLLFLQPYA